MTATVKVLSMRDPLPPGFIGVNTTSRATSPVDRSLSPFYLGPVDLYGGYKALVFENAWQFSKVYPQHDDRGKPNEDYWTWACNGWADSWAHRHPMGRKATPLYAWWDGKPLNYVAARKIIYCPLYASLVVETSGYLKLKNMYDNGAKIALRDFDGYDHDYRHLSLSEVLNNPHLRMGHAFVLKALLTDDPSIQQWRH